MQISGCCVILDTPSQTIKRADIPTQWVLRTFYKFAAFNRHITTLHDNSQVMVQLCLFHCVWYVAYVYHAVGSGIIKTLLCWCKLYVTFSTLVGQARENWSRFMEMKTIPTTKHSRRMCTARFGEQVFLLLRPFQVTQKPSRCVAFNYCSEWSLMGLRGTDPRFITRSMSLRPCPNTTQQPSWLYHVLLFTSPYMVCTGNYPFTGAALQTSSARVRVVGLAPMQYTEC